MKHLSFRILWLLPVLLMFGVLLLRHTSPESFLAKGLADVIYEGSDREVRTSAIENQLPELSGNTAEEKVDRAALTLINLILYICGTIAAIMIIVGGIRYIISAGNEDMMNGAKSTILYACGGFVMTLLGWAIVLNVVRIGSLEERLDYSESPDGGSCDPNVVMFCGGTCCGCTSSDPESEFACDAGLVCGGPLDVVIFEGIDELESEIKVCQAPPEEGS